ncbi:MAG: class I SAM-dependent methyltransferase [Planctomycetaceae bacterium]|nr:class I SAM-dependent methyltransferase [Planctomycetaceae bacterium]
MSQVFSNPRFQSKGSFTLEGEPSVSEPRLTVIERVARNILHKQFGQLQTGLLRLKDSGGTTFFGHQDTGLQATVEVHNPRFYRRVLREGSLGAAESYLEGEWYTDDLTSLLRLLWQNQKTLQGIGQGSSWFAGLLVRIAHLLRDNTLAGSRRNIHEHYDLGNDFFQLFLDETMMYSSAYFEREDCSLKEASEAKLDLICRKLQLAPEDHVLEIGTGWGGFAEHAARQYGCRVTTTTISQEQYDFAQQRINTAGLSDRVEILLQDYRTLTGNYDKLVSIEMIEAVGHRHLDQYFQVCSDRLKPDGTMLIQAITIPDQRFEQYGRSVDFIQKYIFPGGALPSQGAMLKSTSRTDLRLIDLQDYASHYARTLREWRGRFMSRYAEIEKLGFDTRFRRMWEYYFCYCEAAFTERATGVAHLVFAKPEARLEVTS